MYAQPRKVPGEVCHRPVVQQRSRIEAGRLLPIHVRTTHSFPTNVAVCHASGFLKGENARFDARLFVNNRLTQENAVRVKAAAIHSPDSAAGRILVESDFTIFFEDTIMRLAIVAAGAVGGFLAAHLLRAGNHDVALVARGANLQAIRANGLTLATEHDEFTVPVPVVTDDPDTIGPVDAVVFAVKQTDTESAADACRALIGEDTIVVPFQNGVESSSRIGAVLGDRHAGAGCCYVSVALEKPGLVRQAGQFGRFLFAEKDGSQSRRTDALRDALRDAGVDAPVPEDIRVELWRKFSFLVAVSGLTAAGRTTVGEIRDDPLLSTIYRRAIEESVSVARAMNVDLPGDIVERHIEFTESLPAQMRASQAFDLEAGKPLEVDWLSGAVARLGAAAGIDTPVNSTLHAVLKPFANGRRT